MTKDWFGRLHPEYYWRLGTILILVSLILRRIFDVEIPLWLRSSMTVAAIGSIIVGEILSYRRKKKRNL